MQKAQPVKLDSALGWQPQRDSWSLVGSFKMGRKNEADAGEGELQFSKHHKGAESLLESMISPMSLYQFQNDVWEQQPRLFTAM